MKSINAKGKRMTEAGVGRFAKSLIMKKPVDGAGPAAKQAEKGAKGKVAQVTPKETEKEAVAARMTELKRMPIAELNKLAFRKGLEKGLKDDMVQKVLKLEAKEREAVREAERVHKDRLRQVV